MRIALMIAILIGGLAGCDLASGAPSSPAPSASESTATPAPARPSPSALSILHLGEAFLVVASKYEHTVDQIDFRHLLRTATDYRAFCTETAAATAEYIDGLAQIPFGPAQQTTVGTLIANAQIYDAWLGVCARGASLAAIKKMARSMQEAGQATATAALDVRRLLQLPIPTTAP
jgi:hypothetical protein